MGGLGSFSALLSVSTIFCRALHAGSSASKLVVVFEVGAVSMVIISVAACLIKFF